MRDSHHAHVGKQALPCRTTRPAMTVGQLSVADGMITFMDIFVIRAANDPYTKVPLGPPPDPDQARFWRIPQV
jgi:hypothetical protein